MRRIPKDKYDFKELEKLNAEVWQKDCLKYNPEYVCWGNFEDYMASKKAGWASPITVKSVDEGLIDLDEYNECVNFYFEVYRPAEDCTHCDRSGLNPETKRLSDAWYGFDGATERWMYKLTDNEVNALWEHNRLRGYFSEKPTADQVNEWAKKTTLSHDSINQMICVEARAKSMGVYGLCEHCKGQGSIFTEKKAKLALQLWILHPRKGCSKGIYVEEVLKDDLPKIFEWLNQAAMRNARRFADIPKE